MRILSFIKRLSKSKAVPVPVDPNGYLPSFWEDDYCQIEIVPWENKEFIEEQIRRTNNSTVKLRDEHGFTKIFERSSMPITSLSKEFRIDYWENALVGFGFIKAKYIRYDSGEIIDCKKSNTKAYGFTNFTIFFDIEDEFVKNIWLSIGVLDSAKQFETIKLALYCLGEEYEFILIDWNSLELIDLRNRVKIDKYLMAYW
ncbi:hypothetical protein [Hymenobacter sp. GOD-10R]|uniref:hypothetical protein n=1 Tax=Hymenobacter sp. GOD-10R TaxID=3093922 RepID=UPI002D78FD69|nr:hypothetical protein [Hymenobacter sp. GOD-10R]WRQ28405.1 hypothetical protein SD425_25370 [Hymenobacter sp. GOD-10R]